MGTLAVIVIAWLVVVPAGVVAAASLFAARRARPLPALRSVPLLSTPLPPACRGRRVRRSAGPVHCPRRVST